MSVAIVSGSAGLVGASAVEHFASQGLDVIGIESISLGATRARG